MYNEGKGVAAAGNIVLKTNVCGTFCGTIGA
jgi:hypothetical protein